MEIDLSDMVWPVSVIRCNEVLNRLQPGEDAVLIVEDPDVVNNIRLLLLSRQAIESEVRQESKGYRIRVHRRKADPAVASKPVHIATRKRSK